MKVPSLNIFKANKLQLHELNNKSRDRNILRQIFSSFSFKIISVGIGFLLVPILLNKLGAENYGVWAILLSLMQWIALMDIGIGNGLRNKLTEALSKNKMKDAREYVSTAYYSMAMFAGLLLVFILPLCFIIDWSGFFNSKNIPVSDLKWTMAIFIFSVVIYFVLALINQVINAVQRNALTSLAPILTNVLFIAYLIFFFPDQKSGLLITAIAYSICLLGSISVLSLFFFKEYSHLKPLLKFYQKDKIKSILSLGIKFFIIQITCLVIFSTDNVIITQLFGPKQVAVYSIAFVIFNNIGMLINMILMPFYSSYTEAYSKGNLGWIKTKVLLLCKLMIPFCAGMAIVIYFFPYILKIWLRNPIDLPSHLPLLMGIYTIITVWNNIFSYVLNGIGKINLGMYMAILQGILNIPLSLYLAGYCGMGLNGIMLSNIICLTLSAMTAPIQVYYFIFKNNRSLAWERFLS